MKIKSRCEKCNSNLYTRELLEHLKNEGKAHTLCKLKCSKCGHFTQVLDKRYED